MTDNRMTGNRTTELLREGLTERGIEWKNIGGTTSGDGITEWLVDGMTCRAAQRVTVGIEHLALYIPVLTPEQAIAATLGSDKPPYDELLRCLENDWHIHASWDGLRKFWCIELTEEGVRCRDCKHMHTVSGWFGTYVNKCYLPDPETGEILDRNIKNLDGFCSWGEKKGSLENGIR